MSFVHLHCHSEGSLLDGMCRVKDMVVTAREMGMPAVALTDHGVMYNAIEFYERARQAGVKPMLGCCLPGQPVYTEHGIKSIEEIQVGERVLTHHGRYRHVTRTMTRQYQGTLYGIVTHGAATVWLTDEHPVLVASATEPEPRWVRADAIVGGRANRRGGLRAWRSFAAVPRLAPEATAGSIRLCDYLDPTVYTERDGMIHKAKC